MKPVNEGEENEEIISGCVKPGKHTLTQLDFAKQDDGDGKRKRVFEEISSNQSAVAVQQPRRQP